MSQPTTTWKTFRVPEMDCPEEMALIKKGFRSLSGIQQLLPDFVNRSVDVEYDPELIQPDTIARRLSELGLAPHSRDDSQEKSGFSWHQLSVVAGGICWSLALLGWYFPRGDWMSFVFASLATMLCGWPVALAAVRSLQVGHLDMHSLMTIAAVGAMLTDELLEASTAMFLFGVSVWVERVSMDRARRAVESLADLTPSVVHRLTANAESAVVEDVSPGQIQVDDRVLIRPGERIPVDGQVESGRSSVNQAPLTGESLPVPKDVGEPVFAGCLNHDGALEIRVTETVDNSALAHISELLRRAQQDRAPTVRFVDQFARWYTPLVVVAAVLLALVPFFDQLIGFGGTSTDWRDWFHRGLVTLVIACPCALVISTPLTIVCGLRRAAQLGILIKGGAHLEMASRIRSVAIDKTGTLTQGQPRVVDIVTATGISEDTILQTAGSLESNSDHLLARAIMDAMRAKGLPALSIQNFQNEPGLGVRGDLAGGVSCAVGSVEYVRRLSPMNSTDSLGLLSDIGAEQGVAFVIRDRRLIGALILADTLRTSAQQAVQQLDALEIHPVVMVTGDRKPVAEHVGSQLGISSIHAELLPPDKTATVRRYSHDAGPLAMVGDGINDAPAMATSGLGIAMGNEASATALESADVVILNSNLNRVADLFRLGRQTRKLLIQNITLALVIKVVILGLATAGRASMWLAVAADVGASLLVIINGMRILRLEGTRDG